MTLKDEELAHSARLLQDRVLTDRSRLVAPRRPVHDPLVDATPPPARRHWSLRFATRAFLAASDLAATVLAALLVAPAARPFLLQLGVTAGTLLFLGMYRRRLTMSVINDLPYLGVAVALGLLASLSSMALQGDVGDRPGLSVAAAVALAVLLVITRTLGYAAIRRGRQSGVAHHKGLVIGAGHIGIRLATSLRDHPEYGVTPIGFVDTNPRIADVAELPYPVLGVYEDLAGVILSECVSHVIVAFGSLRETELVDILRTCDRLDCEISFVPRLFELHHTTREMDDVWGMPLIHVRRAAFRTFAWKLKRVVDVLIAGVALVVLGPVLLACAVAVRLEGGPGVLFKQERVGLDGQRFRLLKFRSLRPATSTESEVLWNISQDHRVGPVGKFLRASSFDELPQLWNVLTGSMSLVGPRPERQHFVSQFSELIPRYTWRHRVPAGLTGWAQVHGLRGDTSIEQRASFDNYYIENWSLWFDVKIMLRTVTQVIRRAGG